MLIRFQVDRSGRIYRREFTRETTSRYYYASRYGRGGETWCKKDSLWDGKYFESFEAAKVHAIGMLERQVESAKRQLAGAESRLIDAREMVEEQARSKEYA